MGTGSKGGTVWGDMMGKPDTDQITDISDRLANIADLEQARRLQMQEPLRQTLFGQPPPFGPENLLFPGSPGQIGSFLQSGRLPQSLRVPFTAVRQDIAAQGQNVRQDIMSRIPARGGQLNQLLAQQRMQEGMAQAQIPLMELPLRQALFGQALGAAVGQEFPISSTLGSAADVRLGTGQLQLGYKDQASDTIGSLVGIAAGGMG